MTLPISLKTGGRALLVALALSTAGLAAAPAQAAASVSLSFGTPFMNLHFGSPNYYKYCLNDRGIITRLQNRGYDHVRIVRHNHDDDYDNKVWAIGRNDDGDWFQMRIDRCSHKVDKIRLIHKHKPKNDYFDYNHFNLSFTVY